MSRLTVGSIEGLTENSNVISVPTGHTLNAVDGLQIGGNGIGEAVAFTPSWTNLTPGDATEAWYYTQVNDFVYVVGSTTFGSTTSVSGLIYMDYPVSTTSLDPGTIIGSCRLSDSSPTTLVMGAIQHSSASQVAFHALLANTTYVERGTTNATTPFTWASGDRIHGFFAYSIV